MILLGNLLIGIAQILSIICWWLYILLFLHFIFSWINPDPYNMFVRIVRDSIEPLLAPLRRKVPPLGRLDTAFLVLVLGVVFVNSVIVTSMFEYGVQFKSGSSSAIRTL